MANLRVLSNSDPLQGLIESSGLPEAGFWRHVHDTMSEAMIIVSPDRRVLYANESAQALLVVPVAEATGQPCLEAMECPQCKCMCRLFETGSIQNVEVTLFTPERRIFRKNGRLLRNAAGEILGGVETFTDITEEVQARTARQQGNEILFKDPAKEAEDGVFSVDRRLTVDNFSAQMSRLTGYSQIEARGRNLIELLDLGKLGTVQFPIGSGDSVVSTLKGQQIPVRARHKAGHMVPLQLSFLSLKFGTEALLGLARPQPRRPRTAEALEQEFGFAGMLSRSSVMQDLFRLLGNVADTDANVLIQGESGAGKELVARAIHTLSSRKPLPFYAVNCATFTGSLLLSELFGHERGAFTGAYKTQRGKLELADGGTLLLDEVSEIPIQHQALLLRVLESRRFERLGGTESIPFSARVLAATNRPLSDAVDDGSFRQDLFFRLNVVPVCVPPLRERPEDVALLLRYFSLRINKPGRPSPEEISPDVLDVLEAYPWPGNVRELKNLVEYFCFACEDEVTLNHLPAQFLKRPDRAPSVSVVAALAADSSGLGERQRILDALADAKHKRSEAARLLGMDRTTLWRKMKKLGLN